MVRVHEQESFPIFKWKIHFNGTRDESVVFQFLQDVQEQMELANTPKIDVVRDMKILLIGGS
jgi:hypothetical protein